jgi:peroxiredoxin family protein
MANGVDFDLLKKIGECITAIAAAVAIPFTVFPTKWALKKVDEDLQEHKVDDKDKHEQRMQFLRDMEKRITDAVEGNSARNERQIKQVTDSIDSRFLTFERGITTLITETMKGKR